MGWDHDKQLLPDYSLRQPDNLMCSQLSPYAATGQLHHHVVIVPPEKETNNRRTQWCPGLLAFSSSKNRQKEGIYHHSSGSFTAQGRISKPSGTHNVHPFGPLASHVYIESSFDPHLAYAGSCIPTGLQNGPIPGRSRYQGRYVPVGPPTTGKEWSWLLKR